jgi:large conductance mechanosensitive channel
MGFAQDFKAFISRGSVVDLAVGVVIGGAFGSIVNSFVNDVLMPPIGRLTGNVDFSNLFLNLSGGDYATLKAAKEAGAATLNYGVFLNNVINFLIIAFAIFLVIRALAAFQRKQEAAPAPPSAEVQLLTEIRDALRTR